MPSQFFGLTIAYTGLLANNAALNTTSNNIANVQTDGYSRQKVNQQAASALRVFQTYGCAGAGVETLSIERVRDEFYDGRYWDNNAKVGEYSQKQYYMTQIEAYFDDNGKNAGFKTVFDQLMVTGMQELLKTPDDATAKTQFVGYASALAEYFNGLAGNLEKLQKDVNQEIKLKVDEMNSLAGEIATLNKQINTIELSGTKANELRDRRTLLIDQLSQIVDVDVTETPIVDANNPDRETGANRFLIKIAGGQILVDGSEYNGLECVARASYEKVNQTDIDGLYDVYWEDGQKFNLYNAAMGGALKGLVEMRDGNNGENFVGQVTELGKDPNTGNDTVKIQVGKDYLQDLNKCNLSNKGGIINLGNQEFYYDSWSCEISFNADGEPEYSYTFVLSDQEKNPKPVTSDRMGKTAAIGTSLSYQGVPYYMKQMNEWVRTFSQKFNDILTSGYDSSGNQGVKMFTGNHASDEGQFEFPDGSGNTKNTRYDSDYVNRVLEEYREQFKKDNGDTYKADYVKDYLKGVEDDYLAAHPGDTAGAEAAVKAAEEGAWAEAEKALEDAADSEARRQLTNMKITVDVSDDSYYRMTAMNFDILSAMELDPSRLANRYDKGDGVEQNDLLEDIRDLATDKTKMSFRGSSASEFLQCILSDVALNTQRANTFYGSFRDIAGTIDTQRISISGVDEDEEAVNLVKYQNGYNLASKMIQTLTEIYDRLILETGV